MVADGHVHYLPLGGERTATRMASAESDAPLFLWLCGITLGQPWLVCKSRYLKPDALECLQTSLDLHELAESNLGAHNSQPLQLPSDVQGDRMSSLLGLLHRHAVANVASVGGEYAPVFPALVQNSDPAIVLRGSDHNLEIVPWLKDLAVPISINIMKLRPPTLGLVSMDVAWEGPFLGFRQLYLLRVTHRVLDGPQSLGCSS